MKSLCIIAAVDENWGIGFKNQLPWHFPADLKYFRQQTLGHTVLMGRKTYESIGRPLDKRTNIILTHQKNYVAEGCTVINNYQPDPHTKTFVIGGAALFEKFLPLANTLYITHIKGTYTVDTWFPQIDLSLYTKTQTDPLGFTIYTKEETK